MATNRIYMKSLAMVVVFVATVAAAKGQSKYWVVETNSHQKDRSIVRIYDANHNLISEASIDRAINLSNRRDRKMLNRMAAETTSSDNTVAINTTTSRKKTKKFDSEVPVNVE
jgi:hypothetical protein